MLIGQNVTIERSTIGPHVAIDDNCIVRDSAIEEAIIGKKCTFERTELKDAIIGDEVTMIGFKGSASVGSNSEIIS